MPTSHNKILRQVRHPGSGEHPLEVVPWYQDYDDSQVLRPVRAQVFEEQNFWQA